MASFHPMATAKKYAEVLRRFQSVIPAKHVLDLDRGAGNQKIVAQRVLIQSFYIFLNRKSHPHNLHPI